MRSRSPRPLQAKTGGGEDDTDLIPPHLQVPPGRSALLSITPQITMTPRPPSVTSPSLLTGNVLPIPALRTMAGSRVASVPRLPHSSPPLHCTHTARHNFLLPTSDAATGPWPRQTHPFPPRCARLSQFASDDAAAAAATARQALEGAGLVPPSAPAPEVEQMDDDAAEDPAPAAVPAAAPAAAELEGDILQENPGYLLIYYGPETTSDDSSP